MAKILILHGPNLNLLGRREPNHYGTATLEEINQQLIQHGDKLGHTIICYQSNAENQLIEKIHEAGSEDGCPDFLIFNPAAFTHTSIALRDALLAVDLPFIEVHLSNIFQREPFRQHSFFSDIAAGVISGLGNYGYVLAIDAIHNYLSEKEQK
ncbi:MAG: type II 3-dehydroquinate dehydratase [Gammaproteobacteria bacterium]|nr:type II 3-dehydroquinate dehydratase [Gammaproteobacteria bacterium]